MHRLIFVLVLALAGDTGAGAIIGPVHTVGDHVADEGNPSIAHHPVRAESLVVWQAEVAGSSEIRGRIVDSEGGSVGPSFAVSDASWTNDQFDPDVVYDPTNDRYIVVWIWDYSGTLTDTDLVGRFVPVTGPDPASGPFIIFDSTAGQWSPSVEVTGGVAEFMVVWTDLPAAGTPEIQGRRMALDGSGAVTGAFPIAFGPEPRTRPTLVWNDETLQYFVVYEITNAGLELDVYASRLSWAGGVIGTEFGIAGWVGEEHRPSAASCGGTYLVAWEGGDDPFSYIYVRPVAGDGTTGAVTVVNDAFPGEQRPAVACDPDSGLYHTVRETVYPGALTGVATAVHRPDGRVVGEHDVRVVLPDQLEYTRPTITAAGNGRMLAVWKAETAGGPRVIEARTTDLDIFVDGFESGNADRWDATSP